jgi:signal transduction histidine kinase
MSQTVPAPRQGWEAFRPWLPDATLGALVLVAGILEETNVSFLRTSTRLSLVVVIACLALAVGLARRAPGFGLLLVWFACASQIAFSLPLLLTQAAIAVVAFGAARWGSHVTVLLSGLSIPVAGLISIYFLRERVFRVFFDSERFRRFYDAAQQLSDNWQIGAGILATACLAVPWLAGLVLRYADRARASRESQTVAEQQVERAVEETHQAQEIARLREEQNQLARDVHDVVGHSLAVILAQAESAQFLDEADTGALRLSMANIAKSARSSLQDVRQVLSSGTDPVTGPGELRDLVEGVRASGHDLVFDEVGTARPLPPELATVGYRVLQEMLTNAIRHGNREGQVRVELHWAGELRIEVVNRVGSAEPSVEGGHGIEGMRRRLESVGGRLDVRRRGTGEEQTFTATAWLPTRTVVP